MDTIHFETISRFEEFGLPRIQFREYVYGGLRILGFYCKEHGISKSKKCECYTMKMERERETVVNGDWIYFKKVSTKDTQLEDLGNRVVRFSQVSCYLAGNFKTLELTVKEIPESIDLDLNTFEVVNSVLNYNMSGIVGYSKINCLETLLGSIERKLPQYAQVARALMGIHLIAHKKNILGLSVTSETPIDIDTDFVIDPCRKTNESVDLADALKLFGKTAIDQFIKDPLRFVAIYSEHKYVNYRVPMRKLKSVLRHIDDIIIDELFSFKVDIMEHTIGALSTYQNYSLTESSLFVNLLDELSLEDVKYACKIKNVSDFNILEIMNLLKKNMDTLKGLEEDCEERKDAFIKFLRQYQGIYPTLSIAIDLFKKWIEAPDLTSGQFAGKLVVDKLVNIGMDSQRADLFIDALDKDPIWALSIIEKAAKLKKEEIKEILDKMA